jgi:hypothetical protein
MNILYDILGSIIIGGMILLIHIGLVSQMNTVSGDMLLSSINANNAIELTRIIETDFYKIGYRDTTGNNFQLAQQNTTQFLAASHPDSLPKLVHYFLGSKSELPGTQNPDDMPLYRQIFGETKKIIGTVNDFKLIYLDSLGKTIDYSLLTTEPERRKIKGVTVVLKIESGYTVTKSEDPSLGDVYPFVEWKKTIFPRNTRAL